jgi:hypothetical protein
MTCAMDRPTYSRVVFTTSDTLPVGLSPATEYWTVRVGATTSRLATSLANAQAGTVIAYTDAGTGTHNAHRTAHVCTLTNNAGNFQANLTTGGDLNIPGRKVRFVSSGTLPSGLSAETDYWLTRQSATAYRISTTVQGAMTATSLVAYTDAGSGTHEMILQ